MLISCFFFYLLSSLLTSMTFSLNNIHFLIFYYLHHGQQQYTSTLAQPCLKCFKNRDGDVKRYFRCCLEDFILSFEKGRGWGGGGLYT